MKLNLGCGSQVPAGWTNVDYSVGARFAKIPLFSAINKRLKLFDLSWNKSIFLHDLTKRFPWRDSTVDVVYTSHTLEHFTRDDGRRFLRECHRVLGQSGIIRVVVPDLRHIITGYFEGRIKADEFIEELLVLYGNTDKAWKDRLAPFIQFPHKCMYDTPRLLAILDEVGFAAAARGPFDSDIGDIQSIELENRTQNAVIVEGRKR